MAPLKERDQEVAAHENAHLAAAGQFAASGPVYDTQTGPDGKSYRVGGHVKVDTTPIQNDPKATQDKMNQIVRAALAPANPSGQDQAVASQARGEAAKAQVQLSHPTQQGGGTVHGPNPQQHAAGGPPQSQAPTAAPAAVSPASGGTTTSKP
ncbi:MAG: putative metalloprotease CJM1_0395 family protein [Candidatus Xenobia bacterium]